AGGTEMITGWRWLIPLSLAPLFLTACGGSDSPGVTSSGPNVTSSGVPPCGIEGSGIHPQDCNNGADNQMPPPVCGVASASGGTSPLSIAVDPTGRFAYVANQGCASSPGSVSMYTIGPTGILSSLGTVRAGSGPISLTIDPLGKFAYVANTNSKDVS